MLLLIINIAHKTMFFKSWHILYIYYYYYYYLVNYVIMQKMISFVINVHHTTYFKK